MLVAVVCALGAAALNAGSSVLQRKAARAEDAGRSFSLRMLGDLMRRPVWLAGCVLLLLGAVTQATALTIGGIAAVEPVQVLQLPLGMIFASMVFRRGLSRRDWGVIAVLSAGLAVFLACLSPRGGDAGAVPWWAWLAAVAASAVGMGVLVAAGARRGRDLRAALLGVATGVGFALSAALFSGVGAAAVTGGATGVLASWQTYAVIVVPPLAFFVWQNALQAGQLEACQPAVSLTDPVLALLWGVFVFGEVPHTGPWLVGTVAGAAAVGYGVVLLARSPVLQGGAAGQTRSGSSELQHSG